ncbi:CBO0543 family protein [Paenibacillus xanthanilyticus]|uniref:CBO0543 family protein n=1 Tax=Paenibacillus xanthanilyticus TaxID=1783531 RepID=A0ABV8K8M6_9BACL
MEDVKMADIYDAQKTLSDLRWQYWQQEVVFSWRWWLLLIVSLVMIGVWLKLSRKSEKPLLLLYGLITLLIAITLDVIGAELMLWDYPYMVLPWGARLFCADLGLSVILSLLYQYFRSWKGFAAASTCAAAVFAFVIEPVLIWLNMYNVYAWEHYYSFLCYVALACGIKAFTDYVAKRGGNPLTGSR